MIWLRALKETARAGLTIERRRLEPLVALRGAAGLALVVGVTLAMFGPVVAVSSAFGAYQAAIAIYQRSWRPRPVLALASGTSLAVSTFLGYLTASHLPLLLVLLTVWTFAAGLAWAIGTTVGVIAASNVAIMLVTITLPTSVAEAAGHAAVIAIGGGVQALLIVLFPVRRWGAQRDALADALAAEADYARRLRENPTASFDPEPLMLARSAAVVSPRQARRRPAELHGARGIAERIRPVLASLADPAVGVPVEGPERERVRELLAAAGTVLDAAAHAIREGKSVRTPRDAMDTLKKADTLALLSGPPRRAVIRLAALMDDVVETARGEGAGEETHRDRPPPHRLFLRAVKSVRAELRWASPVLRHAVRVSAVVCAGYLLGTALPLGHGYWAPMTSVMVMRPDFSQTYARSVARFGGTLVGVGVATAVVQGAHPGVRLSGALAVLCAFCVYLVLRTGYVAANVGISAYVVFLLNMGGEDAGQTVRERVVLTLLGGLIAMISYALYPAWETPRLRNRLADWLKADGRYAAAVVAHYAQPADVDNQEVRQALLAARDARIAWQDALARAIHEPVRSRGLTRAAAEAAEHALAQMGRSAMLMEAHLPEHGAVPVPAAAALADALRQDTERAAKAVRERRSLKWDGVRAALAEWEDDDTVLSGGTALLAEALEELTDALDDGVRR
ncbi:fusaric acid resistance protein [Streptomyces inusitatus]|uniref:Fusaric acid resistance protein n=1 Tax=Streptomyces inusitatus TaxID=68221 RepID=A0A918PJ92_9ACTN|nr:FUSC family protein [Streptomyces inusitatus]GGZ12873.1 fusaric acid resistance protein [Streptomyces inusitatus]